MEEAADLEDDFEDEQEDDEQPEAKDVHEDFVTWEATSEDEKDDGFDYCDYYYKQIIEYCCKKEMRTRI